ncbi:MAG TPA: hypothetical protein VJ941_10635 [Gracilimonas sp.]|nr:hypothetical protein [Gracilimonas sp.]
MQKLSRLSGIQVLTNTGYYGAVDNRFMPDHTYNKTSDELSQRWIEEFQSNIYGSGVRPGFIKISVAE